MQKKYKIFDLIVQCDFRYPTMLRRSEKFLCETDREPDIVIPFNEKKIGEVLKKAPHFNENDCEIMSTCTEFFVSIIEHNGILLHSSAVMVDGKAYLFSAPSGTGKSTHTQQWLKHFGERAVIINDDKPAIFVRDGEVYACGNPWSGSSEQNTTDCPKLQGICVLERSEENFIEPLPASEAIYKILNQTLRPNMNPARMGEVLEILDKILTKVPVWRMGCNISEEAAVVAYEAMCEGRE